ncbi:MULTISPECIES: NAD(P)/FAD-dependent oxidoreductase [Butyricimonas]|uniref:NAD(P)/FAD-dependent oxidoreductase n=1 Tax=Butyricimonas TaxID=574697 RepID=UPI001D067129|nr:MULTISPECIES: NAD(P)/FAD-dependent oxidoreductase [Butyricimonas]MCB6972576.1 NAD(P)/FAD-dependent oxidoreductase [Butyricimonas synergistica]MCG4519585.1 NAD(P)/FAD-dependent oxidoreductase [Butyricimonas sp. DFI.6.44]
MDAISNIPDQGTKKRVVIVGGGFGGLKLARKLNDRDFQVVLLDKNNYHLFQPLLYQVATSGIEPSAISFPFRKIFKYRHDFHIRMCTVEKVVSEKNCIETSIGKISYDYLVIATGAGTNFFGDSTLADRTMQLKTTSDALFNRNRVIESFEKALNSADDDTRKRWLTFVIVGGGATGIELAGALAEMKKFMLPKDYPELDWDEMRILLVDGGERLLNAFSEKSSLEVARSLSSMHVEILLKKLVKEYDGEKLTFVDGQQIVTNNVFWVAGVKANSLPGLPREAYGRGNRLLVDEFNRVKGMADVFALGDTALMITTDYPNGHPQVVQPSIQQAGLLANNLRSMIKGKPLRPFKYKNKGSMATIGRNDAVAELSKVRFRGFFAWLLWLLVHLMSIVGVKNRLFILINWMWSYVTYDQSLRILVKPKIKKSDPF